VSLRFVFDEQLPPSLARAFDHLSDHQIDHVVDLAGEGLGRGTPDADIIEFCAERNVRLVTNDWSIRRKPHEKVVYDEAGIGAFFFYLGSSKTPRFWKIVRIFGLRWPEVEQYATSNEPPFTVMVHKTRGLTTL
jgi:hypothetical protein